jgi:phosphoribosylanthranilate isomerase
MKIKVCGLKNSESIKAVEQLSGVDFSGFIFYDKSPRYVGNLSFVPKKPKSVQRVGVFVDLPLEEILQFVEKFKLTYIQLHGKEDKSICEILKSKGLQVIKVILVNSQEDLAQTTNYPAHCVDYFLFDTKTEKPGGSGKKFNWDFLHAYKGTIPFFLSGGISPSDAATIRTIHHPKLFGVDINSRFEYITGEKNTVIIKEFINNMKAKTSYLTTDAFGFYGEFGGAYIPELLKPNLDELQEAFNYYRNDDEFMAEFSQLLKDYVGRPTPLYFSKKLSEKYGGTIFLKREDLNHTGAHKINNTIGQILLAKKMEKKHIIAETGAGQHGVATATACALMDLKCTVFMGKKDIQRQAPNVLRMNYLGAEVIPATSGSKTLKDATNEAIRYWINHPETFYLIGSVVGPHPYPAMVAEFQSIISKEIKQQLKEKTGKLFPDTVIACVGGGSNAAGAFYHFYDEESVELIAVEASGMGVNSGKSAATSILGKPGVIHGSMTLLMQDENGQITEPYSISAGLDYPGIGPLHAHTITTGRVQAIAVNDQEALKAAKTLSIKEGIIPALETAHALAALDQIDCKGKTIVINLSGRGDKDMEILGNTHH